MVRAAVVLVLAIVPAIGCGRVGFESLGGGGTTTVDASDARGDGDSAVEACNGIDDNGDLAIDEGCGCTPFDLTLPLALNSPTSAIISTGTGYLLLVSAPSERLLQPIALDGTLGAPVSLGNTSFWGSGNRGAFEWTGSELVAVFADGNGNAAWLGRFDGSGAPIGTPRQIDTGAQMSVISFARRGANVGVAWASNNTIGYFRELDANGDPVGPRHTLDFVGVSVLATPDGYLVAGHRNYNEPHLAFVDPIAGQAPATPLDVPMYQHVHLIESDAGAIAVAFSQDNGSRLQRLGLDGTLGTTTLLPRSGTAPLAMGQIARTPTGYRVHGTTLSSPARYVALDLDAGGNPIGTPTTIGTQITTQYGRPITAVNAVGELFTAHFFDSAPEIRVFQRCF